MALMLFAGTNVNLYYCYQCKRNKERGSMGKTSYLIKEADGILYEVFIFPPPHFFDIFRISSPAFSWI